MRGQLLRYPEPGWALVAFQAVLPGAHVLCFGKTRDALEAEGAGFEVRDAIEVVGPQRHRVWLLRKPTEEANIVGQVLKTGTGAIWIDGCRIGMASEDAQKSARQGHSERREGATSKGTLGWNADRMHAEQHPGGRWPSNLVLVHTAEVSYGDSGGASRFFPQFADESELDAWLLRLILGPQMV